MVSIVVAIIVALGLPVSQLRIVTVVAACCCPDPTKCKCADHDKSKSEQPSMKACHNTAESIVSPQAPSFMAPVMAQATPPARVIELPVYTLRDPHEPPLPARPAAPS